MRGTYITAERNKYGAWVMTCLVNLDGYGTGLNTQVYYGYTKREALRLYRQYLKDLFNRS